MSQAAVQGGLDAIHIHGSVGINSGLGIEQMLRDSGLNFTTADSMGEAADKVVALATDIAKPRA